MVPAENPVNNPKPKLPLKLIKKSVSPTASLTNPAWSPKPPINAPLNPKEKELPSVFRDLEDEPAALLKAPSLPAAMVSPSLVTEPSAFRLTESKVLPPWQMPLSQLFQYI